MGRVLLFGTIKMPNFATIYYNEKKGVIPKINGLLGDSLGKSNKGAVNGVAAYTNLIQISGNIIQAADGGDICVNPPSTLWVNTDGQINGDTYIFDNGSGFSQTLSAAPNSNNYRSKDTVPIWKMEGSPNENGYYALFYYGDCG
jgi:hypothetical protein